MKTAIIGGGAAGFFLAINLKEMLPEMEVTIFERSHKVLSKVEISGGGRCNCTNSFEEVKDLQMVYPRGHRLMKRLFNVFDYRDAFAWFEQHGVPLVTQDDHCVFPEAQDSHVIINCFLSLARRYHIRVVLGKRIESLEEVGDYDFIAVTTGGSPKEEGLSWLTDLGHAIEKPVPSLFTFQVVDEKLTTLMGLVVEQATVMIPGTKLRANGPLLITHWGMSGPAILKLSSYAARLLAENSYRMPLSVRWVERHDTDIEAAISETMSCHSQKQLPSFNPFGLPQRLWSFLLEKSLADRAEIRWYELNKKDVNRLVNTLCNDTYQISGRGTFKDEFVTCGGVSLKSVNPSTLESKTVPYLFFAGEVLDIDGITGGFNFQAAWTTAYTVASAIVAKVS
ncbi:MAG: aminoacetone oxidase family FAD-binding enzyme [Prevotella sp.]|nr:aminoacetone oxidase family FAD-binding enzyme [Prevotella sp.]